jgi:hypothetical protein
MYIPAMVGLGGLEPGAKHAVVSNESPIQADWYEIPESGLQAGKGPPLADYANKYRSIDLRPPSERTGNRSRLER